jgi:hypothetical protein
MVEKQATMYNDLCLVTYLQSDSVVENGVRLDSKYLGITAKAADADKLDGIDSTLFARRDTDNTFSGSTTFNSKIYAGGGLHVQNDWLSVDGQNGIYFQSYGGGWRMTDSTWLRAYNNKSIFTGGVVQADGGLKVDGQFVVSADGSVLYENNQALNQRYLAIGAKAADADKIDGINSAQLARTDVDETFDQSLTVAGDLNANGVHNLSDQWILRSTAAKTSLYYGGVEKLLVNGSGGTLYGNMIITGALTVNGTHVVDTLNAHAQRITLLENRVQKTAQQLLDEICTSNNQMLVQRSGIWRCENVVVDTNTNAATLCSGGQYLDGDGICRSVPVFGIKMHSSTWSSSSEIVNGNLACPSGYTTVVACSGGVVAAGNGKTQDNEAHRVFASGNRCYITGESQNTTTITLNTTCTL